jgi:hypothetical protein
MVAPRRLSTRSPLWWPSFHTHFDLNGLQAIVPSVALVASAVAQGLYSHSRATVKSSAQAAGASMASRQGRAADSGSAPIVVQLTGVQPAQIAATDGSALGG